MSPTLLIGAFAIFSSILMLIWSVAGGKNDRLDTDAFITSVGTQDLREAMLAQSASDRAFKPAIASAAAVVRRITPSGRIEALDHRRAMAGISPKWTIERILASKVLGLFGGALFGFFYKGFLPFPPVFTLIGATALGFMSPDLLIKNKATKRQQRIAKELPDVLDQITIGVEAGLGFDAAMHRAAQTGRGPLAEELARTLQHVTAGLSRGEALKGLASRNKIPELKQFVNAILQADQYGIPLAHVLRVQAVEQRRRRRQYAEEKAMKLPVKVLFPLIVCILPALFIVLIGPGAMKIAGGL